MISVLVESSFSRSKGGLLIDAFDGGVELFEGAAKRPGYGIANVSQDGSVRTKDAPVQFAVEEGDATTVRREDVRMRTRPALDQPAKTEPTEVVCRLTRGIGPAEQRGDAWSEVAMTKARREMREATQRLKDREDARIREAERGDPLVANPEGPLQEVERVAVQRAVMTHAFDREQGAIDLITERA